MFWKNKKERNIISNQFFHEEVLNVVTHLTALLGFSFLSGGLLFKTNYFWPSLIFCFTGMNVFASSVMYHYVEPVKLKKLLRLIDHSAINLLIAGTYTAVCSYINSYILLSIIWTMAISNIVEMFYYHEVSDLSLAKYLVMGWMLLFALPDVYQAFNAYQFSILLAGCVSYMAGVYFFINIKNKEYYHTYWHICSALGTLFHYLCIYSFSI